MTDQAPFNPLAATRAELMRRAGRDPFDLIAEGYSAEEVYGPDPHEKPSPLQQFLSSMSPALLAASFLHPSLRSAKPAIMARNETGYPPPQVAKRPFTDDYPRASGEVHGSPLRQDIEGRPLSARYVAGRRTVGGDDVALAPDEIAEIARKLGPLAIVPRAELPRNVVGAFNPTTGQIRVLDSLSPEQAAITLSHELGHSIARNGVRELPIEKFESPARRIYHELRTGDTAALPKDRYSPELYGYHRSDVPHELIAETLRAYMTSPNYIKSRAPQLAKSVRDTFNSDPFLSKYIQFNVPPGAVVAPGGLGLLGMALEEQRR